jgi:hypothetical protein
VSCLSQNIFKIFLKREGRMNAHEALMLVREKYLEELKSVTSGDNADKYKRACLEYPALMTTAHHLWAVELAKGMS